MNTCLIAPVPDLERYVGDHSSHHLVLAHLLDRIRQLPEVHEPYRNFYKERSLSGDYVMLDNGAKENKRGFGLKAVLKLGTDIFADEVVLTDVIQNSTQTVDAGRTELSWLLTSDGIKTYEAANRPRLAIVPQGTSPDAWESCLVTLYSLAAKVSAYFEVDPPVVGIAYHYDHLFKEGIASLIELTRSLFDPEMHLLGWTRRLESLAEISHDETLSANIRSVDSSRPFVYAKAGLVASVLSEYPGRDPLYFKEPIPQVRDSIVRSNIGLFQTFANDDVVTLERKGT